MAIYTAFSDALERKYRATICSKATVFVFLVTVATLVAPLVLTYSPIGFWKKIDQYQEQPQVRFKHKIFLVLETDANPLFWSSYPFLNEHLAGIQVPHIEVNEDDTNLDGKPDSLHLLISVPLPQAMKVFSARVLLLFDCNIQANVQAIYEGLALIEHSSGLAGSELTVSGDLRLQQQELFNHLGYDYRYQESVINEQTSTLADFSFENIVNRYSDRKVTARLEKQLSTWKSVQTSKEFRIAVKVRYPVEIILYRPSFWQVIRNAWMQYVAILVIFLHIGNCAKCFVFGNQLLETYNETPPTCHPCCQKRQL